MSAADKSPTTDQPLASVLSAGLGLAEEALRLYEEFQAKRRVRADSVLNLLRWRGAYIEAFNACFGQPASQETP